MELDVLSAAPADAAPLLRKEEVEPATCTSSEENPAVSRLGERPVNTATKAKPVRAKSVPPGPITDRAALLHVFRYVHGIPEVAVDTLVSATHTAVEESRLNCSIYASTVPAGAEGVPSWPLPLPPIDAKFRLTLGALKATVKAHCDCERATIRIEAGVERK
jgi:hypothetical protein